MLTQNSEHQSVTLNSFLPAKLLVQGRFSHPRRFAGGGRAGETQMCFSYHAVLSSKGLHLPKSTFTAPIWSHQVLYSSGAGTNRKAQTYFDLGL